MKAIGFNEYQIRRKQSIENLLWINALFRNISVDGLGDTQTFKEWFKVLQFKVKKSVRWDQYKYFATGHTFEEYSNRFK
jgi:hypothetical protein